MITSPDTSTSTLNIDDRWISLFWLTAHSNQPRWSIIQSFLGLIGCFQELWQFSVSVGMGGDANPQHMSFASASLGEARHSRRHLQALAVRGQCPQFTTQRWSVSRRLVVPLLKQSTYPPELFSLLNSAIRRSLAQKRRVRHAGERAGGHLHPSCFTLGCIGRLRSLFPNPNLLMGLCRPQT